MYAKLGGMTGTARTQAREFEEVYKLGVVEIPTNKPMVRADQQDLVYKTEDAKWKAVTEDLVERHEKGQPVLVGTVSIEKSERLSGYLSRRGVPHHVLNAKHHEKEAMIVAQAGRLGSVTVATNMAGRGVDILLGGNPEYLGRQEMAARDFVNDRYLMFEMTLEEREEYEAEYEPLYQKLKAQTDTEHDEVVERGGMYVLGTERHESRRIDNQLRGRSGRQGDPGESRFYLSLGDDLMRLFASDRIGRIMDRLKWPEDEPIQARMVTRAIETAQKNVEEQNFEIRKNVLKYDDVMNKQREVIYGERQKILEGRDLSEEALDYVEVVVAKVVSQFVSKEVYPEEWDLEGLIGALSAVYPVQIGKSQLEGLTEAAEVEQIVLDDALAVYRAKEAELGNDADTGQPVLREMERIVLLSIIDNAWREHLYEMDYLQEGIGLRAYGQRDPLVEYQREAFEMFSELKDAIQDEFVRYIYRVQLIRQDEPARPRPQRVKVSHGDDGSGGPAVGAAVTIGDKIPRNAPCPCGSGRKYKKCHGLSA
jgi:preprotein translocase subunit SecA